MTLKKMRFALAAGACVAMSAPFLGCSHETAPPQTSATQTESATATEAAKMNALGRSAENASANDANEASGPSHPLPTTPLVPGSATPILPTATGGGPPPAAPNIPGAFEGDTPNSGIRAVPGGPRNPPPVEQH